MKRTALGLLILVALAEASAADPRSPKPDWVDAASMEYPREAYVTGVGAGDDRGVAQERARGEISKVFAASVSVDTTVSESETNTSQGAAKSSSFAQNVAQNVRTVSQKVLEGVQVVENWQDPATRVHYALAVLERAKARAAVLDKLHELDKDAQRWKDGLDQGTEKISRAKAGMKLMTLLQARAQLNGELRVLDAAGKGLESPIDESAARAAAAKAIAALDVTIDLAGTGSDEIETSLVRALAALGLQSKIGAGEADIAVTGKVDSKQLPGDGSKWQWARSTATIALKDPKTGKIVTQFDATDREASANYSEALRRAHVELGKSLASRISSAITQYFENN